MTGFGYAYDRESNLASNYSYGPISTFRQKLVTMDKIKALRGVTVIKGFVARQFVVEKSWDFPQPLQANLAIVSVTKRSVVDKII